MSGSPSGYEYRELASGEVRITHHGKPVTTLRGAAAARFLTELTTRDPQAVMARYTGNYRHGNERTARDHPRQSG